MCHDIKCYVDVGSFKQNSISLLMMWASSKHRNEMLDRSLKSVCTALIDLICHVLHVSAFAACNQTCKFFYDSNQRLTAMK